MAGMDMSGMDMSGMKGMDRGAMGDEKGSSPHHAPAEFGPNVDSVAEQPQSRLDDPGVGLRNNGRRVLTYADLHTLGGPIDHRPAAVTSSCTSPGHMERSVWSFMARNSRRLSCVNYGGLRLVRCSSRSRPAGDDRSGHRACADPHR